METSAETRRLTAAQSDTRTCTGQQGCGETLSVGEFGRTGTRIKNICRHCEAARQRKRRTDDPIRVQDMNLQRLYGISYADYLRMEEDQEHRCAACKRHKDELPVSTRRGRPRLDGSAPAIVRRFEVDHCHETGRVRGLLCSSCNVALGGLGDVVGRLEAFIRYIEHSRL